MKRKTKIGFWNVKEEAMEMGKTWGEVTRLANNRNRWRSFTDALCSSGSNRN
jgi:hypothetical protein